MNISPTENMQMAMEAVWTHRFRSLLTILGIVIGITTVVTVASLLTGLRQGVVDFFQELGPDNIFLYQNLRRPQATTSRSRPRNASAAPSKPEYADYIKRWCVDVEDVGLTLYIPSVVDGNPITARVPGFESDTINVAGRFAQHGTILRRAISPPAASSRPKRTSAARTWPCIGDSVAEALFPDGNARRPDLHDGWRRIHASSASTPRPKADSSARTAWTTPSIIPLHTAMSRYPQLDRFMITAKARPGHAPGGLSMKWMAPCAASATWPPATDDDFAISTPDQIIQQFDHITGLIGLVAIAISALGLLVGGIGVMNIMLVSVTERTREIGVRKALGARRRDIIGQFLVEAMTLTGAGGVLGIVIAVLITMLVGALVPSLPSKVPAWALVTGFSVSVAVGVFFGVWPAVKAAQLDPVEALRYE